MRHAGSPPLTVRSFAPLAAISVVLCLAFVLPARPALAQSRKVDFGEQQIEGQLLKPEGAYISGRVRAKFPCDIRELTVEQYEACFARHLVNVCGVQVIERERFEFHRFSSSVTQSSRARTIGSAYPYSLQLDEGALYVQWASEFDGWGERLQVLRDQSPTLTSLDGFVATRSGFVFGDSASKRVFSLPRQSVTSGSKHFRKVELPERTHVLLGVLSSEQYVVATRSDVFLMNLDGRAGVRLRVPVDSYAVDPNLDRAGRILLASRSAKGKVYVLNRKGELSGAFAAQPGYSYHLLPTGLVAAANAVQGTVEVRGRTGLVLSRTRLSRPFHQFGVLRSSRAADLFYVNDEGVGVLYGDGFEKSFLTLKNGRHLRVVEAGNGILGVLSTSPSRGDARRLVERRLDFYTLQQSRSRTSRLVEGICPSAIQIAEKALELKPSLRGTMKDGRYRVHRRARKR